MGLGYFVWNENLNNFVADYIKENFPKILVVGGGQDTNINANFKGAQDFFFKK